MMFFPRKFLKKTDGDQVIESIKSAEAQTSGEIRVHFHKKLKADLMDEAVRVFHKLKMDETDARNGVLLFIVPSKKQFCILGDEGINAIVPDNFWNEIKDSLQVHFKSGNMAEGICENILRIGEKLKTHFPIQTDDKNELPDTISFG